jgi:hypothetical protein
MALNTAVNIGIRRNFASFGDRNFENSGTVQYVSGRENLEFLGTLYDTGVTLPFDVGGVSYSAAALRDLELYWNAGLISPLI